MKRGRELYREGTPDNIKKGYTDLVYGGENVSVDKGVISAPQSGGGGGGGTYIVGLIYHEDDPPALDKTGTEILNAIDAGMCVILVASSENDRLISYLASWTWDPEYPSLDIMFYNAGSEVLDQFSATNLADHPVIVTN